MTLGLHTQGSFQNLPWVSSELKDLSGGKGNHRFSISLGEEMKGKKNFSGV